MISRFHPLDLEISSVFPAEHEESSPFNLFDQQFLEPPNRDTLPPLQVEEQFPEFFKSQSLHPTPPSSQAQSGEKRKHDSTRDTHSTRTRKVTQAVQQRSTSVNLIDLLSPDDSTSPLVVFLNFYQNAQRASRPVPLPPSTNILSKIEFDPLTLQRAKLESQTCNREDVFHGSPSNFHMLIEEIQFMSRCRQLADKIFSQPYAPASTCLDLSNRIYSSLRPVESLICPRMTQNLHDFESLKGEDKEILAVANLCFSKCLERLQSEKSLLAKYLDYAKEPEALQKVILPTLFYQNVFLRSPYPTEFEELWEYYVTDDDDTKRWKIKALVRSNCSFHTKKIHHMIVATSLQFNKICGFLHFDIRQVNHQKVCWVRSIQVLNKHQRLGVGTTLINYVYTIARAKNCQKIELKATSQGCPFYVNLGFKPKDERVPYHEWKQLTFLQQCTFLEYMEENCPLLELDCTNLKIQHLLQTRLKKVFHCEYHKRPREQRENFNSDLSVLLPLFVKKWGVLRDSDEFFAAS